MGLGVQKHHIIPSPTRAILRFGALLKKAALPVSGARPFLLFKKFFSDFDFVPGLFFAAHVTGRLVADTGQ